MSRDELKTVYAIVKARNSPDESVSLICEDPETAKTWADAMNEFDTRENGYESSEPYEVEKFVFVPTGVQPFVIHEHRVNVDLYDEDKLQKHFRQWVNTGFPVNVRNSGGLPPDNPRVRYVRAPMHHDKSGRLDVTGSSAEKVYEVAIQKIEAWERGEWAGKGHDEIIEGGDDAQDNV